LKEVVKLQSGEKPELGLMARVCQTEARFLIKGFSGRSFVVAFDKNGLCEAVFSMTGFC
jgi:hypothetical protein